MKTKKMLSIILAVWLAILCAGCGQSEQDRKFDELTAQSSAAEPESASTPEPESEEEPSQAAAPEVDESLEGKLTISAWARLMDPSQLEILADEFMERYPNVTIEIDYAENSLSTVVDVEQSRDSYCGRVRAELVSGEADYILYSPPGKLNLYDISQSGVLVDMRPYWDNDPTIDPADYFTQVLDAVSVDGKLTAMPFSFYCDAMYLNRAVLESIDVDPASIEALTPSMLLDMYEKARALDPEVKLFFGEQGKDFLFQDDKFLYLDMDSRTASFDSPEFLEFLERTNAVDDAEPDLDRMANLYAQTAYLVNELLRCRTTGEETTVQDDFARDYVEKGRPALACVANMNMSALTDIGLDMEYMAGPYPVTDSKGRLPISSIDDFAIPSSVKDPDLAWAFISYCLRERESTILKNERVYGPGLLYSVNAPLNKKNFALLAEESQSLAGSQGGYENLVGKNRIEVDGEGLAKTMEGYLSRELLNRKLYTIDVNEILAEYYDSGLTTAEQCAEKLQGRAYIWLNE